MTPVRSHSDAVGRVANKVKIEGGVFIFGVRWPLTGRTVTQWGLRPFQPLLLRSEISLFWRTSCARDFCFTWQGFLVFPGYFFTVISRGEGGVCLWPGMGWLSLYFCKVCRWKDNFFFFFKYATGVWSCAYQMRRVIKNLLRKRDM